MSEVQMIPIAKPVLGDAEVQAVQRAVLSGWVTQGPEVAAFETEFAAFVGARHACAVANCTAALHLALLAVGVGPGDEVITVSHSFVATANAIRYCNALPVFVDIQREGFNIDPERIAAAITERTKAILVVHQLGMPCDLARILPLARARGIAVIEDAACAAGSKIFWEGRWERIGKSHADIACFSFHPRKVITTGDGGMLTTSNADYDRRFRLLRQHGMTVTDAARHRSGAVIFENYAELAYNYRMTDLQAAMGREQLKRLPELVAARRRLAQNYALYLRDIPGLTLPVEPAWAASNWQSYCVGLPTGRDQRAVMQAMLDKGVATRRGVMNSHLEPAYAQPGSSRNADPLVNSVNAQAHAIMLPLYAQMTEAEQMRVVEALVGAIATTAMSAVTLAPVVAAE